MSKYTTEVRFICETEAGLPESVGMNNIEDVVEKVWNKIFYSNFPIFDEEYRKPLCKKIIKHFYTREIGAETVALWKFWINRDMNEIMPYFNQLYKSALLEFDPLKDTDYKTSSDKTGRGTSNQTTVNGGSDTTKNSGNDKTTSTMQESGTDSSKYTDNKTGNDSTVNNGSYTNTHDEWDKYSDTPQGSVSRIDLENNAYLTNTRHTEGVSTDNKHNDTTNVMYNSGTTGTSSLTHGKKTNSESSTAHGKEVKTNYGKTASTDSTSGNTENYVSTVAGKMHGLTYSEMLMKFRETFLNIDMQVIASLEDNFLGLW